MMMKRGKVEKQGESKVASYRYLGPGVSNPGIQMKWNEMSVMFPPSVILGPKRPLGS